jgi:hypothetical protein
MITDPRHRKLLQRAIDAQTVVSDELQTALNARMNSKSQPDSYSERIETLELTGDIKVLEKLVSVADDLLHRKLRSMFDAEAESAALQCANAQILLQPKQP